MSPLMQENARDTHFLNAEEAHDLVVGIDANRDAK